MSKTLAPTSPLATPTWAAAATLPPALTERLLADVDVIAGRMTRHIATEITLPDQFHTIGYLRSVTGACRDALRTLVRLLRDGRGLRAADLQRLGSMGAQQAEMGVPLEVLLAAYRLAARVVWRELIGQSAMLDSLPGATVITVTGQVLEYLDEISGAVGAAYLETRERLMRRRDRDRDRILQRLIAGDAGEELRRLAAATDIDLRPPYAVVACALPSDATERAVDRVLRGRGVLVVPDQPATLIALVPVRTSVTELIDEAERAVPAGDAPRWGVGPVAGTLEEVAESCRRARDALAVGRRLDPAVHAWNDASVGVFASLARDPAAMQRYVETLLGPLLAVSPSRRRPLMETLEALLVTATVNDAATLLGLHRHTLVYRTRRLTELGLRLEVPTMRHRLWLAMQCHRLLQSGATTPS